MDPTAFPSFLWAFAFFFFLVFKVIWVLVLISVRTGLYLSRVLDRCGGRLSSLVKLLLPISKEASPALIFCQLILVT